MRPGSAPVASSTDLRPLPLGELLDRAFNLYFRNILTFTAILAVMLVPHTIVQYLQSKDTFDILFAVFRNAASGHPDASLAEKLQQTSTMNNWFGLDLAFVFLALPLANAAVVVAISKAYLGQPFGFADSYRLALKRWLSVLILEILWCVAAFVGVLVLAIAGGVVGAMVAFLSVGLSKTSVAGAVFAVLMILLVLAVIAVFMMLFFTFAFSFVTVVLEHVDPVRAFGLAFSRVFGGHMLWRSVALALALAAVDLVTVMLAYAGGGLLAYFLKSPALIIVLLSLTSLVFAPFALLVVGVYYYDVRIRREGLDLQLLAERFGEPTPPAATA